MQELAEQNFGFLIHDVARLLRWNFDRRARTLGLTRAQWSVLAQLRRQDGLRQTDLAGLLDVQPITLVRLLDRLEKQGWVERREHKTDRRAKRVFLTKRAAPMIERLATLGKEKRKEALSGVAADNREK